jgi:hypothetical protein
MFGKYNKFVYAVIAGLAVAVPALSAANNDGTISLQEWLTILGLFLPAVATIVAPSNTLDTGELVKQAIKNPDIDLTVSGRTDNLPK